MAIGGRSFLGLLDHSGIVLWVAVYVRVCGDHQEDGFADIPPEVDIETGCGCQPRDGTDKGTRCRWAASKPAVCAEDTRQSLGGDGRFTIGAQDLENLEMPDKQVRMLGGVRRTPEQHHVCPRIAQAEPIEPEHDEEDSPVPEKVHPFGVRRLNQPI